MNVHFLIPGDIETLTGGYVYNKIIIEGLRKLDYKVSIYQLPVDFPFPSDKTLEECNQILTKIPFREPILIDSLAFGPLNKIIAENFGRNPIIPIIHLPLSYNPKYSEETKKHLKEQERNAFEYSPSIIAVSEFTKQLIVEYGINPEKIRVITPGVFKVPRKINYPHLPKKLLCVGSYLPAKGQLLLVQVLAEIKDKDWTLTMHGIQYFDPEYVQLIENFIVNSNLGERIFMKKQVSGNELIEVYLQADLFILPSLFENFSMALSGALTHGLPVITTNAGGISFSVPENMGLFVTPGNKSELIIAINELLTNPVLYKRLYLSTSAYYKTANTWENSVQQFHSLLAGLS